MQQLFISERDQPVQLVDLVLKYCLQRILVMFGLMFAQTDSLSLASVHLSYIIWCMSEQT